MSQKTVHIQTLNAQTFVKAAFPIQATHLQPKDPAMTASTLQRFA